MRDLAFYNAGCEEPRGLPRLVVPFRRLLRRVLRPIFLRQVELFQELERDLQTLTQTQQELARKVDSLAESVSQLETALRKLRESATATERLERLERLEGLEDDHLAAVRRLAALEDQVESLLRASDAAGVSFPAQED